MVCYPIVVDEHLGMAKSVNSNPNDLYMKSKQINHNHIRRKRINPVSNTPSCEQSAYAIIDVIIMIAVISASGFLLHPYVKFLSSEIIEFFTELTYLVKEEMIRNPMIYTCLGLSISFAIIALFAITFYATRTCGKPGCRGLKRAAEFDIQLETEDCVKSSNNGTKKGLFELPLDHHRELEAELKKMAPINGRAVLVFRARCGCSVGRMEVPGVRKARRIKK